MIGGQSEAYVVRIQSSAEEVNCASEGKHIQPAGHEHLSTAKHRHSLHPRIGYEVVLAAFSGVPAFHVTSNNMCHLPRRRSASSRTVPHTAKQSYIEREVQCLLCRARTQAKPDDNSVYIVGHLHLPLIKAIAQLNGCRGALR